MKNIYCYTFDANCLIFVQAFHQNERFGTTDEQTAVEISKKNFLQAWSDYIEAVKKNTEITERFESRPFVYQN